MPSYKILRKFFDTDIDDEVLVEGCSLEEAREHCKDPETSSRTCKSVDGLDRTERMGPWFDAYEEE